MDLGARIAFLEQAGRSQRAAMRTHVAYAVCTVLLGAAAVAVAQAVSGLADVKWLVSLGGALLGTLAGLPIRELLKRRERLAALRFLHEGFERLRTEGASAGAADAYDDLFRSYLKSCLGG